MTRRRWYIEVPNGETLKDMAFIDPVVLRVGKNVEVLRCVFKEEVEFRVKATGRELVWVRDCAMDKKIHLTGWDGPLPRRARGWIVFHHNVMRNELPGEGMAEEARA